MRINLITYNNQYGLTKDVDVLINLLKRHFRNRVEIFAVNFFDYKCNYVDLNIFLETVSFTLFKYAPLNILIPNQEWYYRTWIPYIKYFDKILVKSDYGKSIFQQLLKNQGEDPNKVQYIGWLSQDKHNPKLEDKVLNPTFKKDYQKYIHVCGKSKHKQTQLIVDSWLPEFPHIDIIYSPQDVHLTEKEQDNITYHRQRVSEEDLIYMLNECGIHICCSDTEGFGHYIQEAKSCQGVIVTTDAPPMNSFVTSEIGFLVKYKTKKTLKTVLGSKYIFDPINFQETIKHIMTMANTDEGRYQLKEMGQKARASYLETCRIFRDTIKTVFRDVFEEALRIGKEYKKTKKDEASTMKEMLKDENLPSITIITPTFNRPHMFRMALYNYINFNYPSEKMQWVIVDDGDPDKRVGHMIPNEENVNIKYIALGSRTTIGMKRNLCIEHADNEIIVCMDDDDYYPPNSLKIRVLELLKSGKKCVTCTTFACFHINKLISMINVPPHRLSFGERISEATLCFYKSFWEERPFRGSCHIGEAKDFLEDRADETHEISWEGIIVSLLHNRNVSGKVTMGDTPNGCHFGWDNKLYLFITNLDIEITPQEEKDIIKSRRGGIKFADKPDIIEYRNLMEYKPEKKEDSNENEESHKSEESNKSEESSKESTENKGSASVCQ